MSFLQRIVFALVATATGLSAPVAAQTQAAVRAELRDRIGPDVVRYCGPAIQEYARQAGEPNARNEVAFILKWYFRERHTLDTNGRPQDVRLWNDEASFESGIGSPLQYTDARSKSREILKICLEGRAMFLAGPSAGYLTVTFKGDRLGGNIYRVVGGEKHLVCSGVTREWPCVLPLKAGESYALEAAVHTGHISNEFGKFSQTFTLNAGDSEVWIPADDQ
jgi:hypothetical protein